MFKLICSVENLNLIRWHFIEHTDFQKFFRNIFLYVAIQIFKLSLPYLSKNISVSYGMWYESAGSCISLNEASILLPMSVSSWQAQVWKLQPLQVAFVQFLWYTCMEEKSQWCHGIFCDTYNPRAPVIKQFMCSKDFLSLWQLCT